MPSNIIKLDTWEKLAAWEEHPVVQDFLDSHIVTSKGLELHLSRATSFKKRLPGLYRSNTVRAPPTAPLNSSAPPSRSNSAWKPATITEPSFHRRTTSLGAAKALAGDNMFDSKNVQTKTRHSDNNATGLGINIWGHDGEKKRYSEADLAYLTAEVEDEFEKELKKPTKLAVLPSHANAEAAPQPTANVSTKPDATNVSDFLDTKTNEPKKEDTVSSLIDEFAEKLYRGQAETFTRISSRASSARSRKSTPSTGIRPASAASAKVKSPRPGIFDTPTRQPSKSDTFVSGQRNRSLRTPSRLLFEPVPHLVQSPSSNGQASGFSPAGAASSPVAWSHRVYRLSKNDSPVVLKRAQRNQRSLIPEPAQRGPLYFTNDERQAFTEEVNAKNPGCDRHGDDCAVCRDLEYAYLEDKLIATTMSPEDRQKIIANNRALRNIRNEAEDLFANGAISGDALDQILNALPAESSLSGSSRQSAAPSSPAPTNEFQDMRISNGPPPPAYNTPTPPSLPTRENKQVHSKPAIAEATAMYRYAAQDDNDCALEVGDSIVVYKYENQDWWIGKNLRTGKEGVFPTNYVQVTPTKPGGHNAHASPQGVYGNEKNQGYGGYPGQYQQQAGPPPPGPSNPYNSAVPPMQIAEQPTEGKPGKGQEMGKKFGKKLGNAAIFGAGATIGGNIVNSIF